MDRWGYLLVEDGPRGLIRPTASGRRAAEVWRPLFSEMEERWKARFGTEAVERLKECLWAVVGQFEAELPDCLPILGYGLFSKGRYQERLPGAFAVGASFQVAASLRC